MKEKRKGFTLIELLAVIVVLAIIALIATPIVLNLIKSAKKGAFVRSAEGVLKSAKTYYLETLVNMEPKTDVIFTCDNSKCISGDKDLGVTGSMGTGTVIIRENGNITFSLTNNTYCAIKYENSEKINIKEGNCSDVDLTNDTTKPVIENISTSSTTKSITVVVSAKDEESGVSFYEYSIDGGLTYEKLNTNIKVFYNLNKDNNPYQIKVKVYNGTYGKDNYSDDTGMAESDIINVSLKDIDEPIITVSPEGWSTEKDVEIDYKGAVIQEYSLDNGLTWNTYNGSFKVYENINVIAKASDEVNEITNTYNITTVDTILPTVSYSIQGGTYNSYQTVRVTPSDENYDYMMVHVYKNGTKVDEKSTDYTTNAYYDVSLDSDGTWTIYTKVYDKAGNIQNQTPKNSDGWYYQEYIVETGPTVITTDLPEGVKSIIYLDPINVSNGCNAQNSVSTTGTKSGCMKWYAYAEDNDSYTMILDHNTTANVSSLSDASTQLTSDTAGWIGNPRLITGEEIADITGNTSWTSTGLYCFLDTNSVTRTNEGKYHWLYDYTYDCISWGCKVEDNSTEGYWTSTPYSSSEAWSIYYIGGLHNITMNYTGYGVRPVITVLKSNF